MLTCTYCDCDSTVDVREIYENQNKYIEKYECPIGHKGEFVFNKTGGSIKFQNGIKRGCIRELGESRDR